MDVVVVGGGLAGLCAAVAAAERGARVTLLERGESVGGSLLYSSGYIWSYRDLETFRLQAPRGDERLQRLILRRLEASLSWLEELGASVISRDTGNPLTFGAHLDPVGLVGALISRAERLGVCLRTRCAMRRIEEHEGVPAGVVTETGERLGADAVVLATGGFGANPRLVERHITADSRALRVRAAPGGAGDGMSEALRLGARHTAGMDEFYGRNMPAPPAGMTPERWVSDSQLYGRYAVAVNYTGRRYTDEAADWSETLLTRATVDQPHMRAWYVLGAEGLAGRIRAREARDMVEAARAAGAAVIQANSLPELTDALAKRGVEQNPLIATLEEYNAAAEAGTTGQLSPLRSMPAPPLRTPPFVAVEVEPAITHTMGGIEVDAGCRVMTETGPLHGLYCAGVDAGGVSTGGYTSGLAQALVFGVVVAESSVSDYCSSSTR